MITLFANRPAPRNRAALTAACAVVVLLFWPQRTIFPQLVSGPTQSVLAGSRVFGAKQCTACHAVNGLGGTVGPDLGRIQGPRSFYDLATAMWNHLPRMIERMREMGMDRPRLTPRETGDLIAFLFWLDYFDSPGDAAAGKRLFAEKRCVVCHQVGGVGGVVGPNLDFLSQYSSPIQVAAAMWNHGPAMAEAMRTRGITRPTFSGSELTDLVTYLKSTSLALPQEPVYVLPGDAGKGRDLFADKGCVQCHSVRGEGASLGPDLAHLERRSNVMDFAAAMWNKAPTMMTVMRAHGIAVPQFGPGEMADLLSYLYSVQYFREIGSAERGLRRVRDKGCLGCHSLDGRGGKTAGDLAESEGLNSQAAVIAALWNHVLVTEADTGRGGGSFPTFRPSEMADLAALLQTLARNRQ